MTYYFPFMDNAGFILLIPAILIVWMIVTSSTPWRRRRHLWRKLLRLLHIQDQDKP